MVDAVGSPQVFLLPPKRYAAVRLRLLALLRGLSEPPTYARVRAGSVLSSARGTVATTYSAFEPNRGRRQVSRTIAVAVDLEVERRRVLARSVEFHFDAGAGALLAEPTQALEAMSVSALDEGAFRRVADELAVGGLLMGAATWDPADPVHYAYLWDQLSLSALVTRGRLLVAVEDAVESFGTDSAGRTYIVPSSPLHGAHPADGQFEWGLGGLLLEREMTSLPVPPELPPPAWVLGAAAQRLHTPAQRAFESLRWDSGTRISPVDDRARPARSSLPCTALQFPDPDGVLAKVRGYCLDPAQAEQKWIGFANAGYLLSRPGDPELLTALLCGALLAPFPCAEPRVTADGSLQFGVPVLLPRRDGGYWPLTTAWHCSADRPLGLSTAFPSTARDDLAATPSVPATALAGDWATLHAWVTAEAMGYGTRLRNSALQARGHLIVHHDPAPGREFALWLRRNVGDEAAAGRAAGGSVTRWYLPVGVDGETVVQGTYRLAQVLLRVAGISSSPAFAPD